MLLIMNAQKIIQEKINLINGNRVAPWFVEPKALWMKKHEPENFEKTHKLVSPSGYCTYKMCGEFTMNHGDAQLFYPYEYQAVKWNNEVADGLGIPIEKYPPIFIGLTFNRPCYIS